MSSLPDSEEQGPAASGAPWANVDRLAHFAYRDGDVVISVPPKSGTTWTMNIVHQLRSGGDPDFKDIYIEVTHLELVEHPSQTLDMRTEKWAKMPTTRHRAFKTHAFPPLIPYVAPGDGQKDVKYIVVMRHPEEAIVSLHPFLHAHSQAFFDMWQFPKAALTRPTFEAVYNEVLEPGGLVDGFFHFVAAWWPLRNASNVLMMHYSSMKGDHEGSIRRIADFLGAKPSDAEWARILEYCSFGWMKKHEDKFEMRHLLEVPLLEPGGMVRRGVLGGAREDGMTDEIAARIRARAETIIKDPQALAWFYSGGAY